MVVNAESKGYSGLPHWETIDSLNTGSGKWFPGMAEKSPDHTIWESLRDLYLNNQIQIDSERKLDGQTLNMRCQTMASILVIPVIDLTKMVKHWLSMLPSADVNRYLDRDDLEQSIYSKLLRNREQLTGNWDLVKQCIKAAYIDWYRTWKQSKNVDHLQAINLTRDAFLADYRNESLDIPSVVDCYEPIEFKAHFKAVLDSLPAPMAKILLMRFDRVPLSPQERQRWHRFIGNPANFQTMLGVLNGSHTGKVKWVYKAERGRPPNQTPKNGPVVIVTPGQS